LIKRQQGEPIAYLVGFKEFWSLKLAVSPATLIPRPDTEILVEQVLAMYEDDEQTNFTCLDLGTGTGAIALALASEKPNWKIEAVDFNEQAVKLAQTNTRSHQLSNVKVYQSNWFEQIDKDKKFSVIVSNPPYIDPEDKHLSLGDVRFEPKSALTADNAGMEDIIHIVTKAQYYLEDGGLLFLEHGFEQGQSVREIFSTLGYKNIETIKDFGDNERISFARFNTLY
jgi:release factor glutamine methyltransferase